MIPENIYLDYAASTPVEPEVFEKMIPFFLEHYGNSSSSTHQYGWYANGAIKKARNQVAKAINCEESENPHQKAPRSLKRPKIPEILPRILIKT